MTAPVAIFAAAALLPAVTGAPPAAPEPDALVAVVLCSGGSMAMGLAGGRDRTPATAPCCAKGCHSKGSRRRVDHK
jgi:hypothetical protein